MDLVYGEKRTLSKFKVLEVIARVPYQAWEHAAYVAMTRNYGEPGIARRICGFISESRAQQDNEQWHLLILEELIERDGIRENFALYRIMPQFAAFGYYHASWLLYMIDPRLSYRLNADFEDHAEHEYMEFVKENAELLEKQPFISDFENDYGKFSSRADMFRQIGIDERRHKLESLARMESPHFKENPMERSASAVWQGGIKDGDGRISTESGALTEARYGFSTRFKNEPGTNPEELIAAAHASCFAMALSGRLDAVQITAKSIAVKATVSLDELEAGWTVTAIHLDVTAEILGADAVKFMAAADMAKTGCPISRLLGAGARISMDARLA